VGDRWVNWDAVFAPFDPAVDNYDNCDPWDYVEYVDHLRRHFGIRKHAPAIHTQYERHRDAVKAKERE